MRVSVLLAKAKLVQRAAGATRRVLTGVRPGAWDLRVGSRLVDAMTLTYLLGYERLIHLRARTGGFAADWKRQAAKKSG
jgi:hypothetical protein